MFGPISRSWSGAPLLSHEDARERAEATVTKKGLSIWIERFWRSIKQEYIYLNPAENVSELRSGIADYVKFYNYERPHQSLDNFTPASFYRNKEKKVG